MNRHDWFLVSCFMLALGIGVAAHNDVCASGSLLGALIVTRTAR